MRMWSNQNFLLGVMVVVTWYNHFGKMVGHFLIKLNLNLPYNQQSAVRYFPNKRLQKDLCKNAW